MFKGVTIFRIFFISKYCDVPLLSRASSGCKQNCYVENRQHKQFSKKITKRTSICICLDSQVRLLIRGKHRNILEKKPFFFISNAKYYYRFVWDQAPVFLPMDMVYHHVLHHCLRQLKNICADSVDVHWKQTLEQIVLLVTLWRDVLQNRTTIES